MAQSFMAQWVYTDIVKDHFMNPRNLWKEGEDFEADGVGEVGSLACGDQMRVGIKVKDGKISLSMKAALDADAEVVDNREPAFNYKEEGQAATSLASLLAGIKLD